MRSNTCIHEIVREIRPRAQGTSALKNDGGACMPCFGRWTWQFLGVGGVAVLRGCDGLGRDWTYDFVYPPLSGWREAVAKRCVD